MRQYIGVAVHTLKPGITQNINTIVTLWQHSLAQMAGILVDIILFIYLFYLLFYSFQSTVVMNYLFFDDR